MHPVAFTIFGLEITTYGICAAVAFAFVWWRFSWLGPREGLPEEFVQNLMMVVVIAALVGARVMHVVTHWDYFSQVPTAAIFSREGYDFAGGFLAAAAVAVWWCRRAHQSPLAVGDTIAPYLAIAHGIGRIGCFLFGCCYGDVCTVPWGVHFPEGSPAAHAFPGQAVHPVQLYETLCLLLIAGILFFLQARRRFIGQIFITYIVLYGLARFVLEFFRGDDRGQVGTSLLSPSQLVYLVLVLSVVVYFWCQFRHSLFTQNDVLDPKKKT